MKMLSWTLVVLILTSIILILFKRSNGFYERTNEDYDLYRLPLIEPYAIYCLKGHENWSQIDDYSKFNFNCQPPNNYINTKVMLQEIDSVGLIENYIFFNCREIYGYMWKGSYWLMYNTSTDSGLCFDSRNDMQEYLNKNNIKLKFYNPNSIFKDFLKNEKLPAEWDNYVKKNHQKQWYW